MSQEITVNLQTAKVTCPNGQEVFVVALIMLKGAFSLELLGMKRRGESAFAQAKRLFNLKGNKQSVYNQYIEILTSNGILKEN
jgi:hypothetical protein